MLNAGRFGPIERAGVVGTVFAFAASQIAHRLGACFVVLDASTGRVSVAGAADTALFGWWEAPGFSPGAPGVSGDKYTTSSTAGTRYPGVLVGNPLMTFKVPTDQALTAALFGDARDLVVTSDKQMVNLAAGTTDVVRVVGDLKFVDEGLSEAIVQINPAKLQAN